MVSHHQLLFTVYLVMVFIRCQLISCPRHAKNEWWRVSDARDLEQTNINKEVGSASGRVIDDRSPHRTLSKMQRGLPMV